jgi:nucleotide-binding universal stress UspA family protein
MSGSFAIVVASDLSEAGGYAFEQGARLAQRVPGGAGQVHFVYVTSGDTSEARIRQLGGQLRAYVTEKAASMGGLPGLSVGVHVRHGDPIPEIAQLAAEVDAALIVLGTPDHPLLKALTHGSVAERLLPHAPCPVVLAGPRPVEPRVHPAAIEPPCPECLATRKRTNGREWWCARHTAPGGTALGHTYSYQRELPFATHDSEVIPTGIDF